ncbi:CoA-transferase subunit beta [Stygiolobus caldivivus]|uniref:CoA-transferase n=1 Tax=Stygiolobus caldivivus TaxID=2824673 RepID=A0A8D5U8A6_9CREN|nr:CoA-transferase [Stygiolobus caldivivus]BCU71224.1 CoA-transferase [Stygiolobus caldivivus]
MSQVDYVIKAIALQIEDNELVYVGLNSIPALIGSFMARDLYGKKIKIIGVAEADNPKSVEVSPSTGNPFMVSETPVIITADAFDLAQKGKLDVMFLGPVQIDKEANVNLSVIGDYYNPKVRLTGGAATAFILPLVKKAILWNLKHSKRSLVERVDFITGTAKYAKNNVIIVTNLGVIKLDREKQMWFIDSIYENTTVDDIILNTGFKVVASPNLKQISLSSSEKEFIRNMDPHNLRDALL